MPLSPDTQCNKLTIVYRYINTGQIFTGQTLIVERFPNQKALVVLNYPRINHLIRLNCPRTLCIVLFVLAPLRFSHFATGSSHLVTSNLCTTFLIAVRLFITVGHLSPFQELHSLGSGSQLSGLTISVFISISSMVEIRPGSKIDMYSQHN